MRSQQIYEIPPHVAVHQNLRTTPNAAQNIADWGTAVWGVGTGLEAEKCHQLFSGRISVVGHSLPTHLAPVPTNVRCSPIATVALQCGEGREVSLGAEVTADQRLSGFCNSVPGVVNSFNLIPPLENEENLPEQPQD